MTCHACELAEQNPRTGVYVVGCPECQARELAQSPEMHRALRGEGAEPHWPGLDGGRGLGIKSLDLAGAICCSACHDVIDGRAPLPAGATRESVEIDWHRGHLRSLVLLAQKGLL